MPELAEVEFFRKRWSAGYGGRIIAVRLHEGKKVFRGCSTILLKRKLTGARLIGSATSAKQMLFRFSGFGGALFATGPKPPAWWTRIAPAILSRQFTVEAVTHFLKRRGRAPIKAVLLMQERFPGIGNWMADEVLWRAALHPKRLAGSLSLAEVRTLHRECQKVCRLALDTIAGKGRYLPPNLNHHIPRSWLFWHRWEDGGRCPRTGKPLRREEVGGRTTCWSPARQKLR